MISQERHFSAPRKRLQRYAVIDEYLNRMGIYSKPEHEADNLAMAMSLIASTRSVALLPAYAQKFLPWSVISRPLGGDVIPTIDLVLG